ncbi:uncharacterized protein LOC144747477 [Ciona intestinalis]
MNLSDPSNIVLVLICVGTIFLVYHGETVIKVPRYGGKVWKEEKPLGPPKTDWEPPCLPEEAPDYEEKKKNKLMEKIQKDLKEIGVEEVVDATVEDKVY